MITNGVLFFMFGALAVWQLIGLAVLAFIYVAHSDLAHSIEDLKQLIMLRASGNSTAGEKSISEWLGNKNPIMPGDVRFHIPTSLLNKEG